MSVGAIQPNLQVYPNPASNETTVRLNQAYDKPTRLYLYTTNGQQVGEFTIEAGEREKQIPLNNLPNGELWITDKKNGLPLVIIR